MAMRATNILSQRFNVDPFNGIEYTRQSLRSYDPTDFISPNRRKLAVDLVIQDVIRNDQYGIDPSNLRRAIDLAYTITTRDMSL